MNSKIEKIFDFSAAYAQEDGIWLLHAQFPFLFFYEYNSEKLTFMRRIPWEFTINKTNCICMELVGNVLILVPFQADSIIYYDIESDRFTKNRLNCITDGSSVNYGKCYVYGEWIYCIPVENDRIAKINIESREVEYIEFLYLFKEEKVILSSSVRFMDTIICTVINNSNMLEINLANDRVNLINVEKDYEVNFMESEIIKDRIWLYDNKNNTISEFDINNMKLSLQLVDLESYMHLKAISDEYIMINNPLSGDWRIYDDSFRMIIQGKKDDVWGKDFNNKIYRIVSSKGKRIIIAGGNI
ncbi:MAG: hypothetical protein IJ672_07180, partial [Methanobrevibacter sp.]|nr:hypothetical protein [Methanobrevibacter sp.]